MRIGDHVVENIYEPEYFEDEETEEEDDDEQFWTDYIRRTKARRITIVN